MCFDIQKAKTPFTKNREDGYQRVDGISSLRILVDDVRPGPTVKKRPQHGKEHWRIFSTSRFAGISTAFCTREFITKTARHTPTHHFWIFGSSHHHHQMTTDNIVS